jgi:hypothetical protein
MLGTMHESRPVRIVLDLDPDGDTICGAVCDDSLEHRRPFHGWLEPAGVLEAARHASTCESARALGSARRRSGRHAGTD